MNHHNFKQIFYMIILTTLRLNRKPVYYNLMEKAVLNLGLGLSPESMEREQKLN